MEVSNSNHNMNYNSNVCSNFLGYQCYIDVIYSGNQSSTRR